MFPEDSITFPTLLPSELKDIAFILEPYVSLVQSSAAAPRAQPHRPHAERQMLKREPLSEEAAKTVRGVARAGLATILV